MNTILRKNQKICNIIMKYTRMIWLSQKHRQEIAKLESRFAGDLQSQLDSQNVDHRRQICELRDQLLQVTFAWDYSLELFRLLFVEVVKPKA